MNDYPLPFNIEAEQQLLGAVLSDNDKFHRVSSILRTGMFYEPTHGRIWDAVVDRMGTGKVASPVSIKGDFRDDEGLKELGGPGYLARLVGAAISSFACVDYARMVEETWRRRQIMEAADRAAALASTESDPDVAIRALDDALVSLPADSDKASNISMLSAVIDTIRDLNEAHMGNIPAISTGLAELDERLGGFFKSNYIVLAGRPSMGKTALALDVALKAAKDGKKIVIWSREMSTSEITERMISAEAEISYKDMRRGNLDEDQFRTVVEASKRLTELPIQIVPDHITDVARFVAATRAAQHILGGLDMILVDFLQLISDEKARSPGERVSNVSMKLKGAAKLFGVPLVALSQLSRAVESRDDKRPLLSDLRESGTIEQDADVVMFVLRPAYYLERSKPDGDVTDQADWHAEMAKWRNKMEVITAKQRMGDVGIDVVGCHMATNRFWSLRPKDPAETGFF